MMRISDGRASAGLALLGAGLAGCAQQQQRPPVEVPIPPAIAQISPSDPAVRSTIVGGIVQSPVPNPALSRVPVKPGNIRLNFPNADVAVVARSVMTDILGRPTPSRRVRRAACRW